MTDPLDTLRPEVREAVERLTMRDMSVCLPGWQTIRAELLRLAKENRILEIKNAGTLANNLCPDHRDKQVGRQCLACLVERAQAELAALKARIECVDAGIVYRCADCKATHVGASKDMIGKRVALVPVED